MLDAWHQETKDLSLILSRQTETLVQEKLPRRLAKVTAERHRAEMLLLRESHQLTAIFEIQDAASPIEVVADISRRTVDVGMTLRAPEDKKSSKARLNWLLRQVKSERIEDLFVRLL